VGFEPTIPVFERVKTVHALDRAATVINHIFIYIVPNMARQGALETKEYRYILSRRDKCGESSEEIAP
jgi:hypothetical protein